MTRTTVWIWDHHGDRKWHAYEKPSTTSRCGNATCTPDYETKTPGGYRCKVCQEETPEAERLGGMWLDDV